MIKRQQETTKELVEVEKILSEEITFCCDICKKSVTFHQVNPTPEFARDCRYAFGEIFYACGGYYSGYDMDEFQIDICWDCIAHKGTQLNVIEEGDA